MSPTARQTQLQSKLEDPRETALAAVEAALGKKALEPVLLDVRRLASYTDFILVVSARSDRQVFAVADGITDALGARGVRPLGVESTRDGRWTLIDFGTLVAHVFHPETREFYDLEGLWVDAPRVAIEVPPEARMTDLP